MTVDVLLSKLDSIRQMGPGRWLARCPAHEDRRASLSVRELDDGTVLVHDFAGCSIFEIVAAAGIDWRICFRHARTGTASRLPAATAAAYRRLMPFAR